MVVKFTSRQEAIEKLKWVRERLYEWEERFKGRDWIGLPPGEKRKVIETVEGLERFDFGNNKI